MKTLGVALVCLVFFAAMVGACGASGNPVSGDGTTTGGGSDAAAIDSAAADSSYGSQTDSGGTTPTDSGPTTPIDSGTKPDDAGVIFTGGGTCDITDGLTITVEEIVTFIGNNSPASCSASTPCDSSHCCLDISSATGGGSIPDVSGICLTQINLSALGL